MSKRNHDWEISILANRLWNLKVDQIQRLLVELEALCNFVGLNSIDLSEYKDKDGTYKIEDIVKKIFEDSIRRSKAI